MFPDTLKREKAVLRQAAQPEKLGASHWRPKNQRNTTSSDWIGLLLVIRPLWTKKRPVVTLHGFRIDLLDTQRVKNKRAYIGGTFGYSGSE